MRLFGRSLFFFILLLSMLTVFVFSETDAPQTEWKSKEIAKGLTWKTAQTDALGSRQNINVLEVDLRKRELTLVYDPTQNRPTSEMAQESGALAAVNAGFFDMKEGGSVTYLKMDGQILGDTLKWRRNQNLNGALIIKTNGRVEMELAGSNSSYTRDKKIDDVLVTGSLLIDEGEMLELPDNSFVRNRHPRTCLGIVNKHKVLLVTIDGRSTEAAGMSLPELQEFLESLGCREAINLDGGGSTTMWVASEEPRVVNRPSDNRKFDHKGERNVSSILAVK